MLHRVACVLVLLAACKSGGSSAQPKGAGGEPNGHGAATSGSRDAGGPTATDGKANGPSKCGPTGRIWDGKPTDCPYEVLGCCYDAAEAACSAQGCSARACTVLESYPAQVRCDDATTTQQ